jgi:HlyD family secretion protein
MNVLFESRADDSATRIPPPPFRWKTRIALPLAIAMATIGILGYAAWNAWAPAIDVRGTPVVLAATMAASIPENGIAPGDGAPTANGATVQAAGWVEPLPYPVFATALAEGVVDELLVLEGDRVTKGQVVARLIATDAAIGVDRARGELHRAESMLVAAQTELESLVEQHRAVGVAEAKRSAAEAALDELGAERAAATAMLAELEDELQRKQALAKSGAVSDLEIAQLGFRIDAQRATVRGFAAKRVGLEAGRAEADADLEAARRSRDLLVRERAELGKAEAERTVAEAALREAELRLSRMSVSAPVDGIVLARLVSPGMMVSSAPSSVDGGRILSLYDPKELQVRADVPNADIALVGIGQRVEIKVEALPNATLTGEVLRITAQADIAKNTVQVKVRVIEPPPELRPEMLCRVRILTGSSAAVGSDASAGSNSTSARQRVFAPKTLLDGGYAVVAGSLREGFARAERRQITTGSQERDGWIEIIDGLRPGDVLLDPHTVPDAARVRVTIQRSTDGGGS